MGCGIGILRDKDRGWIIPNMGVVEVEAEVSHLLASTNWGSIALERKEEDGEDQERNSHLVLLTSSGFLLQIGCDQ
jgi:hypothetical protein